MPKNEGRNRSEEKNRPEEKSLWRKCPACDEIIYDKELKENLWVCPKCQGYFRLNAGERLHMLVEEKSFRETITRPPSFDHLGFPGYAAKTANLSASDAIVAGTASIGKHEVVIAVMDFEFMGGSMGSVVGDKVAMAAEAALKSRRPLIVVSSSGGARMQEGIISLMQMAKASAAIARLDEAGVLFISIMADPTAGGVSASYAMLGDVNIAERGALICFAGPRVIEETIKQKLPDGFQRAEFLEEHGMVDIVSDRKSLKGILIKLLDILDFS
ncbi:MAG: acetyl-CoA carboxylase, carboxyltransferase subunit beta [Endomicrobiia bacterium]|nr:acetyl-CoA carboxylase, carboxyltransferase subunit beta [Endomicrobiia bacterium]